MEVDLTSQEIDYTPTIISNGSCLQYFTNGRRPHLFENGKNLKLQNIEDQLNFESNGRQPQYISKWKTT